MAKKNATAKKSNAKAKKAIEAAPATVKKTDKVDPMTCPMSKIRDLVGIPASKNLPASKIGVIDGTQYATAGAAAKTLWNDGEGMSVADITRACNIAGLPVSVQTIGSYTTYKKKVIENRNSRKVLVLARTGRYPYSEISKRTGININAVRAMVTKAEPKIECVPSADEYKARLKQAEADKQAIADQKAAEKQKAKEERAAIIAAERKARAEAKAKEKEAAKAAKAAAKAAEAPEAAEVSTDE
jgi:hypothetical protein